LIAAFTSILEAHSRNLPDARRGDGFGLVLPAAGLAGGDAEGLFYMSARELGAYIP